MTKAGVAVLRSFLDKTRLSKTNDNEIFLKILNLEIKNIITNIVLEFKSWISFAAKIRQAFSQR